MNDTLDPISLALERLVSLHDTLRRKSAKGRFGGNVMDPDTAKQFYVRYSAILSEIETLKPELANKLPSRDAPKIEGASKRQVGYVTPDELSLLADDAACVIAILRAGQEIRPRPNGGEKDTHISQQSELKIFVSHSSQDAELARTIVELFEKAMKLSARQIRCTSVNGYRLPIGSDTDEQLRSEIFEADTFVGVITPASMKSAYVLFELGARWAARRHLAPVLARGADATLLAGPLSGLSALRLDDRNQVLQLVDDVARSLHLTLEPIASFQGAVDHVVVVASQGQSRDETFQSSSEKQLSQDETSVLQFLASIPEDETAEHVAVHLNITEQKAKYLLLELANRQMISVSPVVYGVTTYAITQVGRRTLIALKLL